MKRKLSLVLLCVGVFLGLSMTALANTVTLVYKGNYGTSYGGHATGLYKGTLDGAPIDFACDDVHDSIQFNVPWTAEVFTIQDLISGAPDLAGVMFGPSGGSNPQQHIYEPTQLQSYAEAMWIADQLLTHSASADPNVDSWAIWTLLGGAGLLSQGPAGTLAEIQAAETFWASCSSTGCVGPLTGIDILAPVGTYPNGKVPQEVFYGTPEPVSMLLLGTFLSLGGGLLSRKKRA